MDKKGDVIFMKIWIDDIRAAPHGYIHFRSTNEAISAINIVLLAQKNKSILNSVNIHNSTFGSDLQENDFTPPIIESISFDHDAGSYANLGGDYIKVLDFLVEKAYFKEIVPSEITVSFHTQNPVGYENMKTTAERYGFIIN